MLLGEGTVSIGNEHMGSALSVSIPPFPGASRLRVDSNPHMETTGYLSDEPTDINQEGASTQIPTRDLTGDMASDTVQESSARTWDNVTNTRISTLDSQVQGAATGFVNEVESTLGIRLRVTQALRTSAEQDALYAQGRTASGRVVTNARGGESYHNYGLAIDVVEIRDGKAIWNTDWTAIAKVGVSHGFSWGGNWTTPDKPHFQMDFGLSIRQLQQDHRP
ncbi:MAG TPA: hypothetical protein ENI17_13375 [Pseudomonas xinjiangensis]|uniref:Peptidase M15C domain-containing protein n=2 Tax=root TaxID=1 RepID=A0A7V1BNK7_9GAMM|nr:hypothetical protein [Halopseudomonas xinjiangensis]HEC48600.1 hypothetical protein [Halopseudomonas xinjiangensis]